MDARRVGAANDRLLTAPQLCVAIVEEVVLIDDRSAVLVLRVWEEESEAFRARLTTLGGAVDRSPAEEVTVAVASSPSEVIDAVRAWLDDFLGHATDSVDSRQ